MFSVHFLDTLFVVSDEQQSQKIISDLTNQHSELFRPQYLRISKNHIKVGRELKHIIQALIISSDSR